MKIIHLVLMAGVAFAWSDTYQNPSYTAVSAQTPVFALRAGATTGVGRASVHATQALTFSAFYTNAIHYRISGLNSAGNIRLSLYDLNGRLITRKTTSDLKGLVPLNSPLSNGIYLLRLDCAAKAAHLTVKLAVVR